MAGCRLNLGGHLIGHLIVEVQRPGHGEPVQFDSSLAVLVNHQRSPTITVQQQ